MDACVAQFKRWRVGRFYADGALPVPGVYGVPEQWPHIARLYTDNGFVPAPDGTEILHLADLGDVPDPGDPPLPGLTLRRMVGINGTRLSACLGPDMRRLHRGRDPRPCRTAPSPRRTGRYRQPACGRGPPPQGSRHLAAAARGAVAAARARRPAAALPLTRAGRTDRIRRAPPVQRDHPNPTRLATPHLTSRERDLKPGPGQPAEHPTTYMRSSRVRAATLARFWRGSNGRSCRWAPSPTSLDRTPRLAGLDRPSACGLRARARRLVRLLTTASRPRRARRPSARVRGRVRMRR
jgi:hypothetical protein